MKVLFLSNDPDIFREGSAVQKRMQDYAAAIGVLHILGRAKGAVEKVDGPLHLHGVPSSALFALLTFPAIAKRLIQQEGIEVVSAQDPFEYGFIAMQAIQGTSAKLHIQVHADIGSPWFTKGSFLGALKNTLRLRLADKVLPRANAIRVVSKRVEDALKKRYGEKLAPVAVLPIPPEESLPPATALPSHTFHFALIAIGRLEEEKCFEDMFRALFKAQRRYPTLGLIVVGDGRLRSLLEEKARHCCLPQSVMFLGKRDDALSLLQSANGFIQTSAHESYGRTLLEAALARVPIITTEVGIVGEVLTDGRDALVAPVHDIELLSRHIETLIEDSRLRTVLLMNARTSVQAHLSSYRDTPKLILADLARALQSA